MKALIADDEPHLAAHLRARLAVLWPELEVIGVANHGLAARDMIEAQRPEIAFLDIRMPGLSGLEVLGAVSAAARAACRVVFVTAYDEFAVQAFEREAVDYLLKPVTDERLALAVARLRRQTAPTADDLLLRLQALLPAAVPAAVPATAAAERLRWVRAAVGSELRLVAVEDICYFQATDKYTTVFTRDAELLIRTPLKELLAQLDPEMFWQVHRATVVNVRQIVSARPDAFGRIGLRLRERGEVLAVSRSFAHLFRQM